MAPRSIGPSITDRMMAFLPRAADLASFSSSVSAQAVALPMAAAWRHGRTRRQRNRLRPSTIRRYLLEGDMPQVGTSL
jgi:hypothetical protein